MSRKRNIKRWALDTPNRLTLNQKIGGLLYDFIDQHRIELSDGSSKIMLSGIREETHMSDRTLRRVFCGQTDALTQYLRVLTAIFLCSDRVVSKELCNSLFTLFYDFANSAGEQFLEEQALQNKPKRKSQ